ncbi:MAG TPA: OmpA family protein [Blastocatellia bacterium]|nr:OmpA family protein [Blastocatellia bacterium]
MKSTKAFNLLLALVAGLILLTPAMAQDQTDQKTQNNTRPARVSSGQKQKINGVIIKRDADSIIVRDQSGSDVTVSLTSSTQVQERKSNPFRRGKNYGTTSLLRGLPVEIEGRGDSSGALVANKIKFSDNEFKVAQSIESRVTPVEGRVGEAENRLTQAEQNAQRLSGQLEELSAVANTAKGGAKAAQETADAAIAGVNATNDRISMLDDYDATKTTTVNFKVRSAMLSPEAKTALDDIANQAKTQKAFIIQVAGFASADGPDSLNRRLSQERADAVVRYLAENHNIPLRRIITPFGYGESNPVADNSTRDGRQQNRRVEVSILVNKGLMNPASVNRPTTSSSNDTRPPDQQ